MFLDTMGPRTENKNASLGKTVLIMWAYICGISVLIVHKMTSEINNLWNQDLKGENFALRNVWHNLHMFLDNIELRIENDN